MSDEQKRQKKSEPYNKLKIIKSKRTVTQATDKADYVSHRQQKKTPDSQATS
jgi:hypothetical protein